MAAGIFRSIRTNRRAALIAGALAACSAALLAFQGGAVINGASRGASWVVGRVVKSIAYRDVSDAPPDGNVKAAGAKVLPTEATVSLRAESLSPTAPGTPAASAQDAPFSTDATGKSDAPPNAPTVSRTEETFPAPATEEEPEETRFLSTFEPYRSYGLRDPMLPLVEAGREEEGAGRFSVAGLTLVGIAWKGTDRVALLEDDRGRSFIYRHGDMAPDGARVVSIRDDSITFAMVRYGETSRLTLQIAKKEEEN